MYKYWKNTIKKFIRKRKGDKSLTELAIKYHCDKWGAHYYTPHYDHHFNLFKQKEINLIELGIGGYSDPNHGGASLRMWKDYFQSGNIYGVDIYDKNKIEEKRIRTFQGSQTDEVFLKKIVMEIGNPEIIIDDGSHINSDIITSFQILFPLLKIGGIYVIEDVQTSYWPSYGGDSTNLQNKSTAVNFFKSLIDSLNYQEIIKDSCQPSYFDRHIISIHFYHNIIFIYKGENDEPSNMVKDNKFIT